MKTAGHVGMIIPDKTNAQFVMNTNAFFLGIEVHVFQREFDGCRYVGKLFS